MNRLMLGLLATVVSASLVRADGLIPPPRGKKHVSVTHSVKLDKDINGYQFFTRQLGPRSSSAFEKIELSTDKAVPLKRLGKFGLQLVAVPESVAKKYDTEKDLLAALSNKLEGTSTASFSSLTLISDKDERKRLDVEHTITGFDGKNIQMKNKGDESDTPEKQSPEFSPTSLSPILSGLALTLAFATGGLWVVRRRGNAGAMASE
jgi:hypothetical protein